VNHYYFLGALALAILVAYIVNGGRFRIRFMTPLDVDVLAFEITTFNLCINCSYLYHESYAICPICTSVIHLPLSRILFPNTFIQNVSQKRFLLESLNMPAIDLIEIESTDWKLMEEK
jgi:hypothetical protein